MKEVQGPGPAAQEKQLGEEDNDLYVIPLAL